METQQESRLPSHAETIWCDGRIKSTSSRASDKSLGHPRIYLTYKDGHVDCPYCGQSFTQDHSQNVDS